MDELAPVDFFFLASKWPLVLVATVLMAAVYGSVPIAVRRKYGARELWIYVPSGKWRVAIEEGDWPVYDALRKRLALALVLMVVLLAARRLCWILLFGDLPMP